MLEFKRELHGLEKLFLDDGRTEPSPLLIERVGELLGHSSLAELRAETQRQQSERAKSRDNDIEPKRT